MLPANGVAIQVNTDFTAHAMQRLTTSDVVMGAQTNYFMAGIFGGPTASMRLVSYAMLAVLTQVATATQKLLSLAHPLAPPLWSPYSVVLRPFP